MNCEDEIIAKFAATVVKGVPTMNFYESYGREYFPDLSEYDNDELPWPFKYFSCSIELDSKRRLIIDLEDIEGEQLKINKAFVTHRGFGSFWKEDIYILTDTLVKEGGDTELALKEGLKNWIAHHRTVDDEARKRSCHRRLNALN